MLIINNGVPKSGSTWMQTILRNHIDPQYPSETWANGWMNPSVDHEKLEGYIASGEWRTGPTLLKLHLTFTPEFAFLDHPEVRIVVSYRNLPDSVVSWFHHQKRQGEVSEDQKQRPGLKAPGGAMPCARRITVFPGRDGPTPS